MNGPPQAKFVRLWITELRNEVRISALRGSARQSDPLTTNLYSWFVRADDTSADQTSVVPSRTSRLAVLLHPLNMPAAATLVAFGAHTRNVTPVPDAPV